MGRKPLGQIFLDSRLITQKALEQALFTQKRVRKPLGKILEENGLISDRELAKGLSRQFNLPYFNHFSSYDFPATALKTIPAEYALVNLVFPLKVDQGVLYVAMADPLNVSVQDALAFRLGMRISTFVATPAEIKTAIRRHYGFPQKEKPIPSGDSILHIDRQNLPQESAAKMLAGDNLNLIRAKTAKEGLALALSLQPKLILTELQLPDQDGKALFTSLQNHPEAVKIPVIILAKRVSASVEADLLGMGFFDVIGKPVDATRLQARVRRALRLSALRPTTPHTKSTINKSYFLS